MDVHTPIVEPEPNPGYDDDLAVGSAFPWSQRLDQAPGTVNCPQGAGVGGVMRWIGQKGCAGLSRASWAAVQEQPAELRATEQLFEKYN